MVRTKPLEPKCRQCGSLPVYDKAYLDRDQELEPAVRNLEKIGESFRRCPGCGSLFFYDYWPPGPGNIGDFETLTRLTPPLLPLINRLLAAGQETTSLAKALEPACSLVQEKEWNIVGQALDWLSGRVPPTALVRGLVMLLGSCEPPPRHFAALRLVVLAKAGKDLSSARSALVATLEANESWIRRPAGEALAVFLVGKGEWSDVRDLLSHHDARVRHGIVQALESATVARLDLSPVFDVFEGLLVDPDPDVRNTAIEALYYGSLWGGLDPRPAVPWLVKALRLKNGPDKGRVARTLGQFARKGADIATAFPDLILLLEDNGYDIRQRAAGAFASAAKVGIDLSPAVNPLVKALTSDPFSFSTLNVSIMDALNDYAGTAPAARKAVLAAIRAAGCTDGCREVKAFLSGLSGRSSKKVVSKTASKPKRKTQPQPPRKSRKCTRRILPDTDSIT